MATAAPVKPYRSTQAIAIIKIKHVFFSVPQTCLGVCAALFAMSYSYDDSVDEQTCHSVYETLKNNGKVSTAVLRSIM